PPGGGLAGRGPGRGRGPLRRLRERAQRAGISRLREHLPDLPRAVQSRVPQAPASLFRGGGSLVGVHLEGGDEGFLGDLDFAELAHALLAGLLLVEELALAAHVAAVALGGDVLAQRPYGLARHDAAADGRLDRDLE